MKSAALAAVRTGDAAALEAALSADESAAEAVDEAGVSILLQAVYRGRADLVDLILAAEPALDVCEAAALGHPEWIEDLLDVDPDAVQAQSADGFTALHLAAQFGHGNCVDVLLRRGADPRVPAADGRNVAQIADDAGHEKLAAHLRMIG